MFQTAVITTGGADFSPVVKWRNHPHVAQISYLQRLQSGGMGLQEASLQKKTRSPAPAQAVADH